jgi:hypothetical protein
VVYYNIHRRAAVRTRNYICLYLLYIIYVPATFVTTPDRFVTLGRQQASNPHPHTIRCTPPWSSRIRGYSQLFKIKEEKQINSSVSDSFFHCFPTGYVILLNFFEMILCKFLLSVIIFLHSCPEPDLHLRLRPKYSLYLCSVQVISINEQLDHRLIYYWWPIWGRRFVIHIITWYIPTVYSPTSKY